jgi:hypothetical protein
MTRRGRAEGVTAEERTSLLLILVSPTHSPTLPLYHSLTRSPLPTHHSLTFPLSHSSLTHSHTREQSDAVVAGRGQVAEREPAAVGETRTHSLTHSLP